MIRRILIIAVLSINVQCSYADHTHSNATYLNQTVKTDSSTPYALRHGRKLIRQDDKVYIDTAWNSLFPTDSVFVYYYSVRSKYPESSETICGKAEKYLRNTQLHFTESGYITFRFFVDSTGEIQKRVQVLQANEYYKENNFNENLVWILFDFLKTLHDWKPAIAPKGFPPFYINLMTFKIHEGKIINIIP